MRKQSVNKWVSCGMTYAETLNAAEKILSEAGIPDAASDAMLLFENVTGLDRAGLLFRRDEAISDEKASVFRRLLEQRLSGEPVQYIIGEAWFYGYKYHVGPGVLIPRFDTELLIEEALKAVHPGMKVLDLCTGSGCIIITLSKEADIRALGSDLSEQALAFAKRNRDELGADCRFVKSDLFSEINESFDLIVSNPPYIRTEEIGNLQKEIREHEPHLALDGGTDGLDIYRRIAVEAPGYLVNGGMLMLEIGYDQAEDVTGILKSSGFSGIEVKKDLAGLDRVVKAKKDV